MKVKFTTEKELDIHEDAKFRREFLDNLAKLLTETMPVNVPVPEKYEYDEFDEEYDKEIYEECNACEFAYYEAVIKNLGLATNILNMVSQDYFILPTMQDIADDKIHFIMSIEEHYYFFQLPAAVSSYPVTIIKK